MKTSKKDFLLFKKECQRWIEKLGLSEWECHYYHKKIDKGVGADTCVDVEASKVVFRLNAETGYPREESEFQGTIEQTAKHEVMHLLLGPLSEKAKYRYVRHAELESAEHGIVMRLMKAL